MKNRRTDHWATHGALAPKPTNSRGSLTVETSTVIRGASAPINATDASTFTDRSAHTEHPAQSSSVPSSPLCALCVPTKE